MSKRQQAVYDTVVRWGNISEINPHSTAEAYPDDCPLCILCWDSCSRCPVTDRFGDTCEGDGGPFPKDTMEVNWDNDEVFTAACFLAAMEGVGI